MDYLVYASGAITIAWIFYIFVHTTIRNSQKFWRSEVKSGKFLRKTFGFLLSSEERAQIKLDQDQQHVDELLFCARGARDQVRSLTQRFVDPSRTTQALDALPGRTSRQLVDEIAQIERDITGSMGQLQQTVKAAVAAWTRGTNLLERFEVQQDAKTQAAKQTVNMGSNSTTTASQTVVETTGVDLVGSIVYMCRFANSSNYTPLSGDQVIDLLRQGKKIGRDFYIMGLASEFATQTNRY